MRPAYRSAEGSTEESWGQSQFWPFIQGARPKVVSLHAIPFIKRAELSAASVSVASGRWGGNARDGSLAFPQGFRMGLRRHVSSIFKGFKGEAYSYWVNVYYHRKHYIKWKIKVLGSSRAAFRSSHLPLWVVLTQNNFWINTGLFNIYTPWYLKWTKGKFVTRGFTFIAKLPEIPNLRHSHLLSAYYISFLPSWGLYSIGSDR